MDRSTLLKIPRTRLSYADEMLLVNGCPGVIGLAAVFSGEPPAPDRVRARVAERWSGLERMHQVLDRSAGGARWTVPGPFDPGAHVAVAPAGLDALWGAGVDRPLPGGLPPWRLYVVPGAAYGGDFALALVAQHTLLDGRSLATLMRALVDEPPAARGAARPEIGRAHV